MKALILSGGKGTRLYPLTYTRAKQLIPLANTPILARVIASIRDAGVTDVGVIVGDTRDEIRAALGDGSALGVQLTYIHQPSPDGLAHAVKIAQPYLADDPFVMFLGDNVLEGGIRALVEDFVAGDSHAQIVLKRVPNPTAYGVATLHDDGSIARLVEKPKVPPSDLALVGVYLFRREVFSAVNAIAPSARGELEITDAIQWLVDHNYRVRPHIHDGWWIDTGKSADMLEANGHVLDELLLTTPRAERRAATSTVDEASEVDARVVLAAGVRIVNSVVRGPAVIGENTVVDNCYVGPYTSLYHHVTLRNCEIERSIVLEHSTVEDLPTRLHDSLIGRKATVRGGEGRPRALKMNLADHSTVLVV